MNDGGRSGCVYSTPEGFAQTAQALVDLARWSLRNVQEHMLRTNLTPAQVNGFIIQQMLANSIGMYCAFWVEGDEAKLLYSIDEDGSFDCTMPTTEAEATAREARPKRDIFLVSESLIDPTTRHMEINLDNAVNITDYAGPLAMLLGPGATSLAILMYLSEFADCGGHGDSIRFEVNDEGLSVMVGTPGDMHPWDDFFDTGDGSGDETSISTDGTHRARDENDSEAEFRDHFARTSLDDDADLNAMD